MLFPENLLLRPLFDHESSTYTYLLADSQTREGVLVDCVREQHARDYKLIEDLQIKLKFILETHIHADHVTGAGLMKQKTSALTAASRDANIECLDQPLKDGDVISFGRHQLKALATPGHTNTCMCYLMPGMVITGDTLLIRACGRTDFQQGSPEKLYDSVHGKLFTLPDSTMILPAHNYQGQMFTSIGEEKQHNPRLKLSISKNEFVQIMNNLKLDLPKKINEAVPLNEKCGMA